MPKLDKASLWSLEQYAERRPAFRAEVIEHKKLRRIALGEHATFYFEDFLTMKYQVQEMLRVERIYEAAEILSELEAYNPLIPDGRNLKATFMIEYPDAQERRVALGKLGGIEDTLWLQAEGQPRIAAIGNEDMDRSREDKASAVHFLRFELDDATIAAFKAGRPVQLGIDHPALKEVTTLSPAQLRALAADLD